MHFGISVAVPFVRPPNAVPKDPFIGPFGQPPPMLPYPRPYTLPFGQVVPNAPEVDQQRTDKVAFMLLGGAVVGATALAALFGGSRKGAAVGAAIGAAAFGFGAYVVSNRILPLTITP